MGSATLVLCFPHGSMLGLPACLHILGGPAFQGLLPPVYIHHWSWGRGASFDLQRQQESTRYGIGNCHAVGVAVAVFTNRTAFAMVGIDAPLVGRRRHLIRYLMDLPPHARLNVAVIYLSFQSAPSPLNSSRPRLK